MAAGASAVFCCVCACLCGPGREPAVNLLVWLRPAHAGWVHPGLRSPSVCSAALRRLTMQRARTHGASAAMVARHTRHRWLARGCCGARCSSACTSLAACIASAHQSCNSTACPGPDMQPSPALARRLACAWAAPADRRGCQDEHACSSWPFADALQFRPRLLLPTAGCPARRERLSASRSRSDARRDVGCVPGRACAYVCMHQS